jgi:hypothetical protein
MHVMASSAYISVFCKFVNKIPQPLLGHLLENKASQKKLSDNIYSGSEIRQTRWNQCYELKFSKKGNIDIYFNKTKKCRYC